MKNSIEQAIERKADMILPLERERAQRTLERAIDVIHELGWTHHQYRDVETGAVCITGAIRIACHGNISLCLDFDITKSCEFATVEFMKRVGVGPAYYNDTPGRTVEEVLLAMKQVADGDIVTDRIV